MASQMDVGHNPDLLIVWTVPPSKKNPAMLAGLRKNSREVHLKPVRCKKIGLVQLVGRFVVISYR
jgi:hypothetical protein